MTSRGEAAYLKFQREKHPRLKPSILFRFVVVIAASFLLGVMGAL